MSLQVKLTSKTAKSVTTNFDGSYDVYSNENKRIMPGQLVQLKTGNIISTPLGYYILVNPCELLNSHGIDAFNFASIHYHKYKFKNFARSGKLDDIKNDQTELVITLKNVGSSEYLVKSGDVVAKLIIVKTEIFPVNVVNSIENEIDDTVEYQLEKEEKEEKTMIKSIDKNVVVWFKKYYVKNKQSVIDMLGGEILEMIDVIENSQDYEIASNKLSFEAAVLWETMSQQNRDKLIQKFNDTVNDIDLNPQKKEKPKPKIKPKYRNRMESTDSEDDDIDD